MTEPLPPGLFQPGGRTSSDVWAQQEAQRPESQQVIARAREGAKLSLAEAMIATRSTADGHVQFLIVKPDGELMLNQVLQGRAG